MPTSRVARMSEIETFNEQELLQEARARGAQPLAGREGMNRYGAAAALVAVGVGLWIAVPPSAVDVPLLFALIVGLACASRIEFEFGPVYTAPLQLVVVPLLLLFPPAVGLPAVAAGLVLSLLPDVLRGNAHPDRLMVAVGNAWFAVGPVLLLALAGGEHVSLERWPLYLAVLASQCAFDGLASGAIERIGFGLPLRSQSRG